MLCGATEGPSPRVSSEDKVLVPYREIVVTCPPDMHHLSQSLLLATASAVGSLKDPFCPLVAILRIQIAKSSS